MDTILTFAVLKQWLLQQSETEASFDRIILLISDSGTTHELRLLPETERLGVGFPAPLKLRPYGAIQICLLLLLLLFFSPPAQSL